VARHLNSFRHFRRMRRIDSTVALAVAKVEDEADEQPDDESHPVGPTETVDHRAAGDDAENCDQRRSRNAEPAFELGIFHAHDPNTCANENERKQGADAGHFAGDISGYERGERARESEEEPVRFPRCAKAWMNIGKNARHEPIPTHGEENARLA